MFNVDVVAGDQYAIGAMVDYGASGSMSVSNSIFNLETENSIGLGIWAASPSTAVTVTDNIFNITDSADVVYVIYDPYGTVSSSDNEINSL